MVLSTSQLSPNADFTFIDRVPNDQFMKYQYLMSDQTLFRDRDVFEIDHIPDQFEYREAQLRELAFSLSPGLHGSRPLNTILRGLPGTGKTTSVHRIFSEMDETTRRLVPVYVNCQNERSRFSVFAKIHLKLFGHLPPPTGISFGKILHDICKGMIERNIVIVVCLDDANYLLPDKVLNDTLYSLLRLHEEHPGARAGVIIALSNMDLDLTKELDPCVVSVLQTHEIYFPPYSADEIRTILEHRTRQGLYPGVLSDEMMDLVINYTMQSGDLRVGIELIRSAVLNAERDARKEVIPEDIASAYEIAQSVPLAASIRVLSPQERLLLGHIAELSRGHSPYMTSGAVYGLVKDAIGVGYTVFFERLKKFDEMRLITLTQAKVRGNTREIALRYDAEQIVKECGSR